MKEVTLKVMALFEGNGLRYGAISFSLLLHGLLFVGYGGVPASAMKQESTAVTRMSFLAPSSQPALAAEEKAEVEPQKQKTETKPTPKSEKKIVRQDKPEPVSQEKQKAEPKPETATAQASAAAEVAQLNDGVIEKETERYLTEVMAHIEQHKWYPKTARRRGIEGEVNVSFTLLPDGSAGEIKVDNASPVLLAAARKAVEKAIPMPKPPASIHCPMPCEFQMRFSLKTS